MYDLLSPEDRDLTQFVSKAKLKGLFEGIMSKTSKTTRGIFVPRVKHADGQISGTFQREDGVPMIAKVKRVKEGEMCLGDPISFSPREDSVGVDAEIFHVSSSSRRGYTAAYGEGWDRIFGGGEVGEA